MEINIPQIQQSQDYKDICYVVDHVEDFEIRVDILKKLGYQIAISKHFHSIKDIIIQGNKIKIAISPPIYPIMVMRYAIIKKPINDKRN